MGLKNWFIRKLIEKEINKMSKLILSKTVWTGALTVVFLGAGMFLGKIDTATGTAGILLAVQQIFQRAGTQKAIDAAKEK